VQKEKLIIFSTVLVDVMGFGIVIPILPYYVSEFGASPFIVTLLFASFSFFSFLSAPLLGAWSDRVGRRPILILSIFSTATGWVVFASAKVIWVLFLGRFIDGAAAGNFTIAQSYMADISRDEKERTKNLGLISAMFGIGFLLGPIIGGVLSHVSHSFPFWMAGLMALVNGALAILFLPETHHTRDVTHPPSFNPLKPLARAREHRSLRPLYATWLMFAMAFVTGQSVFALFAKDVFGFSAFQTGLAFTVVGLTVVANQAFLLHKFWLSRFREHRLVTIMLAILAVGLACVATEYLPLFLAGLLALGTGQAVLRVVMTAQVSGKADVRRRGENIGILSALMSGAMVVAPIIAGALFELDHVLPYLLAIGFLLCGLWFHTRGGGWVPEEGESDRGRKRATG
jgi:DHA1 family tetracycline resistance protein-like MFS transporter